jgi:F420-dependent oxidoreductase-like protein
MRLGVLLWPQRTTWGSFRDAALAAERSGADALWTWDHLMAIVGPWEEPILEGWSLLAGLAEATDRVKLGLLVAANTFRNPGLTAKLATTLDQMSDGRAILGLGGAWFEREHDGYGLDFGHGVGERLDRLDEATMLIRRLLDGQRVTHRGTYYQFHDAVCAPRPVQDRLPIMIGGSGPQKTLRTTARYADQWNLFGSVSEAIERNRVLDQRCAEVGRDPAAIERTIAKSIVIRDDAAEARAVFEAGLRGHGVEDPSASVAITGSPAAVAAQLRPYLDAGFEQVIVALREPFDRETIERLPELVAAVEAGEPAEAGG